MIDFTQYDYLSFDCYGTLIDWERGILDALRPLLDRHGIDLPDGEVLELYSRFETAAEQGAYQSYKDVLTSVVDSFAERFGFTPTEEERVSLAASVGQWPPFPDTVAALRELARRYQLVILSNIDDDLFALSAKHLEVEFAAVITAEQVGSYKPNPAHFREALARLDITPDQMLHVAQSLFHDIAIANDLGFTTVWVNRRSARSGFGATPPASARPNLDVPDLQTLAQKAGSTPRRRGDGGGNVNRTGEV